VHPSSAASRLLLTPEGTLAPPIYGDVGGSGSH
jgi:hypothetical protein